MMKLESEPAGENVSSAPSEPGRKPAIPRTGRREIDWLIIAGIAIAIIFAVLGAWTDTLDGGGSAGQTPAATATVTPAGPAR